MENGAEKVFAGAEAAGDARLLPVDTGAGGRVVKLWRGVAAAVMEAAFADFPVPGPRTVAWCVKYLNRKAVGPREHHKWWRTTNRLWPDMWGVTEHSDILVALEHAGCYDGLDVVNLGSFELLLRRAQLIEYTYSTNGPAPPPANTQAEGSAEAKPPPKKGKGGGRGERRVGMYSESVMFLGLTRSMVMSW